MDALFAAVRLGDAAKLAHLLEKESAFVNSPSQNGEFALHVAARVMGPGAVECIEVLVKHNAKVSPSFIFSISPSSSLSPSLRLSLSLPPHLVNR